jgi:hypothetical protein
MSFDLVVASSIQSFFNRIKNEYFLLGELPEHCSLFFGKQIDRITGCAKRR